MMPRAFDFSKRHSRLDTMLEFVDHWLGSEPSDVAASESQRNRLQDLGVPEPLLRFYARTNHRQDKHGSWIWRNTVPQLLQPGEITPAQPKDLGITENWLLIGRYLGECEVLVPQMPDDTCVVEIDEEQIIYHDSLSDFLVRLALRHIATSRPRWKPIAGYEKIALAQLATGAPSWDVSWRQSDPRGTSGTLNPPFNSRQQTISETVWLLEGGDILAYTHGDNEHVVLSARNDTVLDELLTQHGSPAPTLIEIKLGQHPDLAARQQWTLRIAADGSARMTLQIKGVPTASILPGSLDIENLAKQIESAKQGDATASPPDQARATIVRGPNDNGTRFDLNTLTVDATMTAFHEALQDRTPEFERAWQTYRPEYLLNKPR